MPDMMPVYVHLPAERFTEFAGRLAALGVRVQLYLNSTWLDNAPAAELETIASQGLDLGLEFTIHAPYANLDSGAEDHEVLQASRHRYRQTLTVAERLKATSVVLHPGYNPFTIEKIDPGWLETAAATWQLLLAETPEWIYFHLENIRDRTPEPLRLLLETIASPRCRICWDVGHFNLFSDGNYHTWLEQLGPFIGELHLHNNYGQTDDHLPLDEGALDIASLLTAVAGENLRPKLTIENYDEESVSRSLRVINTNLDLNNWEN